MYLLNPNLEFVRSNQFLEEALELESWFVRHIFEETKVGSSKDTLNCKKKRRIKK